MVHKFFTMLMFVFGLSACSNAYGEEVLNLELLCEGKWSFELNLPEESNEAETLLKGLIAAEIEGRTQDFSERLSIQNNMLGDAPLKVTETSISADIKSMPNDLKKDFYAEAALEGIEVVAAEASIDRLTGKLDGNFEVKRSANDTESNIEGVLGELVKMVTGIKIKGQCTKLDPKKKLF